MGVVVMSFQEGGKFHLQLGCVPLPIRHSFHLKIQSSSKRLKRASVQITITNETINVHLNSQVRNQ